MQNLYNPLPLTEAQKLTYISLLIFLAKADNNPEYIEREFVKKVINRFDLSTDSLQKLSIIKSIDDLPYILQPIRERAVALDLLHCLWFAASVDGVISSDETKVIRNVARILNVGDDTMLMLNSFVMDEMNFLQQACDMLETEEVAC